MQALAAYVTRAAQPGGLHPAFLEHLESAQDGKRRGRPQQARETQGLFLLTRILRRRKFLLAFWTAVMRALDHRGDVRHAMVRGQHLLHAAGQRYRHLDAALLAAMQELAAYVIRAA